MPPLAKNNLSKSRDDDDDELPLEVNIVLQD